MNNSILENHSTNNWMTVTPTIDTLSLVELTLPGTHNAGCDWLASYSLPRHWLACQHKPFYAQLNNGARALDVRLTYDASAPGLGKFRFQHGGNLSSRTLGELVTDVNQFLKENPDEFIILDFHELSGDKEAFDFAYFNSMMIRFLGHHMIPTRNMYLSLNQLKQISAVQRVLVATPWHSALDPGLFCENIQHKWSGSNLTSAAELKRHIIEVLKSPPGTWAPWSLSATSFSVLAGPVDIQGHLDSWFDPAKSDWAEKCNIINVDFIEESKLVSYCRTANLKKATQKI
ncbi:phospholipase [Pseudomonas sp. MDT1-85]